MLFIKVDEIKMVFNAHHIVRISPRGDAGTTILLSVGKPDSMNVDVPYDQFVEALASAGGDVILKTIKLEASAPEPAAAAPAPAPEA